MKTNNLLQGISWLFFFFDFLLEINQDLNNNYLIYSYMGLIICTITITITAISHYFIKIRYPQLINNIIYLTILGFTNQNQNPDENFQFKIKVKSLLTGAFLISVIHKDKKELTKKILTQNFFYTLYTIIIINLNEKQITEFTIHVVILIFVKLPYYLDQLYILHNNILDQTRLQFDQEKHNQVNMSQIANLEQQLATPSYVFDQNSSPRNHQNIRNLKKINFQKGQLSQINEVQSNNIPKKSSTVFNRPFTKEYQDINQVQISPKRSQKFKEQTDDQRDYFNLIFNELNDGLILLGQDEQVIYCNRALQKILNVKKKDVVTKLLDLQNCLEEFKREEKFTQLFQGLDKKLQSFQGSNIQKDLENEELEMIEKSIKISENKNVRSEYVQGLNFAIEEIFKHQKLRIYQQKQTSTIFLSQKNIINNCLESKLLCRFGVLEKIPSSLEKDYDDKFKNNQQFQPKNILLEVTVKSYIYDKKPYVQIMVRDVTLFNQLSVVQQINENKSKMLLQVSNDYYTPLKIIISLSENALDIFKDNEGLCQQYMSPILTSSSVLLNLTNNILDLAQLTAGKFSIINQEFDIIILITNIIQLLLPQALQKGLYLNLEIEENIPNLLNSDPNRIRQIIFKLISNSLKFTFQGGITISLNKFEEKERLWFYKIVVRDTGIGINIEDQSRLFKAFGKIQTSNHINLQSVGLGLMISHVIAQKLSVQFEGKIRKGLIAHSEGKNYGTFFQFEVYDHNSRQISPKVQDLKFKDNFSLNNFDFSQSKYKDDNGQKIMQTIIISPNQNQSNALYNGKSNLDSALLNCIKFQTQQSQSQSFQTQRIKLFFQDNLDENISRQEKRLELSPSQNQSRNLTRKSQNQQQKNPISSINQYKQKSQLLKKQKIQRQILEPVVSQSFVEEDDEYSQSAKKIIQDKNIDIKPQFWFKNCKCKEILIINGENFNLQALTFTLESYNTKIQSVKFFIQINQALGIFQAMEFLKQIQQNNCCKWIKIILMDIEMPITDGFKATNEIRNAEKQFQDDNEFIPATIVACSGHGIQMKQKCIDSGMNHFISKPVQKEELLELITMLIQFSQINQ